MKVTIEINRRWDEPRLGMKGGSWRHPFETNFPPPWNRVDRDLRDAKIHVRLGVRSNSNGFRIVRKS